MGIQKVDSTMNEYCFLIREIKSVRMIFIGFEHYLHTQNFK